MKPIARELAIGLMAAAIFMLMLVFAASGVCSWLLHLPMRIWNGARKQ